MCTLRELAPEYREAAVRVRVALEDEEARARSLEGEERRASLERVRILRGMLRDMRDLRQLTEGYYDRPRDQSLTMAHVPVVNRRE